jgi:DNA-binding transcriptional LysR family regulator
MIGKKVFVTEFGQEVAMHAKIILEQLEEIKNKALAFEGLIYGTLKIAVVSTGKYIMPYFISDFLHQHQGVKLQMDVTNKEAVMESLKRNMVDFALVSIVPNDIAVEAVELMDNNMFLVGNDEISHSKKNNFQSIIEQYPLIYREVGSGTRQTIEKFIKDQKIVVQNKIELTSNEAVKQAILANIGVSVMPLIGLKNELLNGDIKILPCQQLPLKTTWQLIWLKEKKLSYLSKRYLAYLESAKSSIIERQFDWIKKFVVN